MCINLSVITKGCNLAFFVGFDFSDNFLRINYEQIFLPYPLFTDLFYSGTTSGIRKQFYFQKVPGKQRAFGEYGAGHFTGQAGLSVVWHKRRA